MTTENQRVVLITGAAGGLGGGLVKEFVAQGWRVVAGYHQMPVAEGDGIQTVQLDVTNHDQITAVVGKILERYQRLDVVINNAGVVADGLVSQMSVEEWDRVLDVNLKGAFLCSQAVIRPMMKQRDGHIINISSFSARQGTRGQANYAAAKAGMIGLTESLAREVGSRNVRVNAVLPGVLPTGMISSLKPEQLEALASANALGRINSIEEVARFIVFLAGMKNVSGQVFQLDSRIGRWT